MPSQAYHVLDRILRRTLTKKKRESMPPFMMVLGKSCDYHGGGNFVDRWAKKSNL